jgi:hypothetical protein
MDEHDHSTDTGEQADEPRVEQSILEDEAKDAEEAEHEVHEQYEGGMEHEGER